MWTVCGARRSSHSYIENMKDSAFRMFVIMMQPADTLVNISDYTKSLFETKTYLQINDPELFTKLAPYLDNSRLVENHYINENIHDILKTRNNT